MQDFTTEELLYIHYCLSLVKHNGGNDEIVAASIRSKLDDILLAYKK